MLASQLLSATWLLASHVTVISTASVSMVGAVVSSIVNVAVSETSLQPSLAVNVTDAVPVPPQLGTSGSTLLLHVITELHVSLAIA